MLPRKLQTSVYSPQGSCPEQLQGKIIAHHDGCLFPDMALLGVIYLTNHCCALVSINYFVYSISHDTIDRSTKPYSSFSTMPFLESMVGTFELRYHGRHNPNLHLHCAGWRNRWRRVWRGRRWAASRGSRPPCARLWRRRSPASSRPSARLTS